MQEATIQAQNTYNAAADHFDDSANSYWERYGRKTVDRLHLSKGSNILDVACGTGTSAIPAAEAVGPSGKVVAVDVAEKMLDLARAKAKTKRLQNIDFRKADVTSLKFADPSFDAVVSVFGIFFVPDMESLLVNLWKFLKPGGKLAITTWGPNLFEPMYEAFDAEVKPMRPDLVRTFRPWHRLTEPDLVEKLLSVTGSKKIEVVSEEGKQPIESPEAWWKIVLGSGLRSVVEAIGPEPSKKIYEANARFIQKHQIREVETNVIYGVAIHP